MITTATIAGAVRGVGRIAASPIVKIELAAAFRRKRFLAAFTVSLLLVLVILVATIAVMANERPFVIGQGVFGAFLCATAAVFGLLFPAFSCMTIVEERTQRSLDLLVTSLLKPWEIFAGKVAGAFIYCFVFMVATLPVVSLSFLFGGVEPSAILATYAFMIVNALQVSIVGTFASASAQGSIRAILMTYVLWWVAGWLTGMADLALWMHWVGTSTPWFSQFDRVATDTMFRDFGALLYAGSILGHVAICAFFAVAGANRLKPAAYDRATPMRLFALAFILAGFTYYGAWCKHLLVTAPVVTASLLRDLGGISTVAPFVASAFLLFAAFVFSTERAAVSRRVEAGLAHTPWYSARRLLRPGPGRGAWFSLALTAGTLGALAIYALRVLALDEVVPFERGRGDLAVIELTLVCGTFVAFVAALGRFLAEGAKGALGPRLGLAGVALVLLLLPLLAMSSEDNPRRWSRGRGAREAEAPSGLPPSVARLYFLSPIAAFFTVIETPTDLDRAPRYFLRPWTPECRALYAMLESRTAVRYRAPMDPSEGGFYWERYSRSDLARLEAAAIPLHRLTIATYATLAALFMTLAVVRRAMRERREAGGPEGGAPAPAAAPAEVREPAEVRP